jgi:hypothetical protein
MDTTLPTDERLAAFATRQDWDDTLGTGTYISQINTMANNIDLVAVVAVMPGPTDGIDLPAQMEVADREAAPKAPTLRAAAQTSGKAEIDWAGIEKVHRLRGRFRE